MQQEGSKTMTAGREKWKERRKFADAYAVNKKNKFIRK